MNMETTRTGRESASFRDPSGFVFWRDGVLYRQVCTSYGAAYDHLMTCGLYDRLLQDGLMVEHSECDGVDGPCDDGYKVLRPRRVPFISYPYEWCFSQLKSAALLTLDIAGMALDHNMCLKDASAYNVQFVGTAPIFIDTLSFAIYQEGKPWVGYRQFCQHFLAPLALSSKRDERLIRLMQIHLDGMPLDLALRLLPARTFLAPSLFVHLFLHGRAQRARRSSTHRQSSPAFSKHAFCGLIDSLQTAVRGLRMRRPKSAWSQYYATFSYPTAAFQKKAQLVDHYCDMAKPRTAWDFGANDGYFSILLGKKCEHVVCSDFDAACIEIGYTNMRSKRIMNVLPLVVDLTNPSPSIGWRNRERKSLIERGPVDMALCLALVHHLAITNNVALDEIAEFFSDVCTWLVIEFVPKEDAQVVDMLAVREDIFTGYHREGFEEAFGRRFEITRSDDIPQTCRRLYLMHKRT